MIFAPPPAQEVRQSGLRIAQREKNPAEHSRERGQLGAAEGRRCVPRALARSGSPASLSLGITGTFWRGEALSHLARRTRSREGAPEKAPQRARRGDFGKRVSLPSQGARDCGFPGRKSLRSPLLGKPMRGNGVLLSTG